MADETGTPDITPAEQAPAEPLPTPAAEETAAAPTADVQEQNGDGAPPPRLKQLYQDEVRPLLQDEFGYDSPMEHPRLLKITLNMGVGEAKQNAKALDDAADQLAVIAGQRPAVTRARRSIAQFKLREGMSIGCKVTLRGLNVTITTSAQTDDEARALLRHLGMPFRAEGYTAEERAARRRRKMRKYGKVRGRR
jgi:ribosomal protein L5